jgi:hypothetical protein
MARFETLVAVLTNDSSLPIVRGADKRVVNFRDILATGNNHIFEKAYVKLALDAAGAMVRTYLR